MKKYKVILLSGGFDPVHKGHVECIENALQLADEVWIGINNDYWLKRKRVSFLWTNLNEHIL